MIDQLFKIIAPHYCYGCQKIGTLLCEDCKYDIVSEPFERCVNCLHLTSGNWGTCTSCRTPYVRSWAVSERHEAIEALLNGYKFSFEKEAAHLLAHLLDQTLPRLPHDTVISYIPTIPRHIRQRGYDHARLVAKSFASLRGYEFQAVLRRRSSTKQLGSSRKARIQQAKEAFICLSEAKNKHYLIIDDIFTTGSTMKYASQVLLNAGAESVSIAVIARQPLD